MLDTNKSDYILLHLITNCAKEMRERWPDWKKGKYKKRCAEKKEKKEGGDRERLMNKWGGMIVGWHASQPSHIYTYNNQPRPPAKQKKHYNFIYNLCLTHCVLVRLELCVKLVQQVICRFHLLTHFMSSGQSGKSWWQAGRLEMCAIARGKGLPDNLIWICILAS